VQLRELVITTFGISSEEYRPDLRIGDVPGWDSVGHLNLIFAIESAFGVRFSIELIAQLDSLRKIMVELCRVQ
jgi:acyl carrier protein